MKQSAGDAERQVQNVIGRTVVDNNVLYLIRWAGVQINEASWVRVSKYCVIEFEMVHNADNNLRQTGAVYVNQTLAAINHAVCQYEKQMKQQSLEANRLNKPQQSKTNVFPIAEYHVLQPISKQLVTLHTEHSQDNEEKEYREFVQKHLEAHLKGDHQIDLIQACDDV